MKRLFISVSKNIFLFLFLLSFMLISFLPLSPAIILSPEGTKNLFGLGSTPAVAESYDFVLVIDESGSMKKNDPANLRKDAAKLFVYLAETLNKGNRVLVSGFGKTTNIYLPLTDISGNEGQISSAIDKIQSSQALTDMKGALKKIKNELDFRTDKKKTVVIFLTDGSLTIEDIPLETGDSEQPSRDRPKKPPSDDGPSAVPDNKTDTFKEDKLKKNDKNSQDDKPESVEDAPKRESDYLEIYKKELLDLCRQYSNSGIVIHPIAFTKEAELQVLEQMADITGGICYKPQEAKDLRASFLDILGNLTSRFIKIEEQQGPSAITGDFTIGNYIKELVVIGLKNNYNQAPLIKISGPDAGSVSYDKYIEKNIFKIAKIINPAKGDWNYQVNGDAVFVFDIVSSALIEPRYSLYAAGAEVPLEIDITGVLGGSEEDTPGLLVEILKDFKVTASVQNPDGKNIDVESINDSGTGTDIKSPDGIFTGTFASTSEPGYYDINYSVTHLPTGAVSNKVLSFLTIKYPVKIEVIKPSGQYYQPGSDVDIIIKVENTSAEDQAGAENGLIFTADVSSLQGIIAKDLLLLDNGQGADEKAGDGLYSARFAGTASEGIYSIDYFVAKPSISSQAACTAIKSSFSVKASAVVDIEIINNAFAGEAVPISIDLNSSGLIIDAGNFGDVLISYVLTMPDGSTARGNLYDDGNAANADSAAADNIYSALLSGLDQTGRYDIQILGSLAGKDNLQNNSNPDDGQVISINSEGVFYKYYKIKNLPKSLDFSDGALNPEIVFTIESSAKDDANLSIGQAAIVKAVQQGLQSDGANQAADAAMDKIAVKSARIKGSSILKAMSDNTVIIEIELDNNIKAGQYSVQIPLSVNGASETNISVSINIEQAITPYMIIIVVGAAVLLAAAIFVLIYFLYIRPKRRGY